jgi:hypothetical protein
LWDVLGLRSGRTGIARQFVRLSDELQHIFTWRKLYVNQVAGTFGCIVDLKLLPEGMSCDPHDGVRLGIEVFGPMKGLDSNAVLLNLVSLPGKMLLCDVFQEM